MTLAFDSGSARGERLREAVAENTPFWWEEAPVKPLPRQPLAKTLDVAIVGAGYAGLSAGLVLARGGVRLRPSMR